MSLEAARPLSSKLRNQRSQPRCNFVSGLSVYDGDKDRVVAGQGAHNLDGVECVDRDGDSLGLPRRRLEDQ
jgi:hypothetical protein